MLVDDVKEIKEAIDEFMYYSIDDESQALYLFIKDGEMYSHRNGDVKKYSE